MNQQSFDFEHRLQYPAAPGYTDHDTSRQAAKEMASVSGRLRTAVLGVLARGPASADQIADALHESVLAIRPRCTELLRLGLIVKTAQRVRNRSGKWAAVFARQSN